MNNVCLLGRLTDDPEVRASTNGASVVSFRIAVNRPGSKECDSQADFINCVAWRQLAEFIGRYFTKGKMIAIIGTLRTRNYKDPKYPSVTHYVTEVYVDKVFFAGDRSQSNANGYVNALNNDNKKTNSPTQSLNCFEDFEEILSDGNVPF